MANEITTSIGFSASKSGATVSFSKSKQTTMAGTVMFQSVQSVGTTTEAITFPADFSGAPSWMMIYNMDSTNYVQIGLDNADPMTQIFAKLLPGQFILFPANTATLYADANSAACLIQVIATML